MKKIVMASAVMAASAFALDLESRPEASVPTPVETREAFDKGPNMSDKEKGDWQKLREERRVAREQILKNLRENSAVEKKDGRAFTAKPSTQESPFEKNVDNQKREFVREEKNFEEKEEQKEPWKNPMGPGRMEPQRPFRPFPIEKNPWEKQNPRDWEKGPIPR